MPDSSENHRSDSSVDISSSYPQRSWELWTLLGLSVLGIVDAGYLTVKSISGGPVICSILDGCTQVLGSTYASFLGVSVAAFGLGYYMLLTILIGAFIMWHRSWMFGAILGVSILGALVSMWFVYVQFFIIDALCQYCLLSALVTFSLVGLEIYFLQKSN